jgi:large subunit ribosomal protein L25
MASQSTKLSISSREVSNSRSTRRLRREGQVPGVLYGGGDDAVPFAVDERELRHALAARGAVVELQLGGEATPGPCSRTPSATRCAGTRCTSTSCA